MNSDDYIDHFNSSDGITSSSSSSSRTLGRGMNERVSLELLHSLSDRDERHVETGSSANVSTHDETEFVFQPKHETASIAAAVPVCWFRGRSGVLRICLVVLVLLLLLLYSSRRSLFGKRLDFDGSNPFERAENDHDDASLGTRRQTHIYPFRFGCPETCQRATSSDEPMYRMSMVWYLAHPTLPQGAAYDKGYNYQCPKAFVDNF
jgi:hypothetical protein